MKMTVGVLFDTFRNACDEEQKIARTSGGDEDRYEAVGAVVRALTVQLTSCSLEVEVPDDLVGKFGRYRPTSKS